MVAALVLTAVFATSAFAADCPAPPPNARDLRDRVEAAALAFAAMDEMGFTEEATSATSAIPCILEPLEPVDLAAFHRVKGLYAFTLGDEATTLRWFRAARSIDRDYAFPTALVPKGGKVDHIYTEAGTLAIGDTHEVETDPGLEVRVNGISTSVQPLEFPSVIQVLAGPTVLATDLRMERDPFPPFHAAPPPIAEAPPPAEEPLPAEEPPPVAEEPPPVAEAPPPAAGLPEVPIPGAKRSGKSAVWATAIGTGVVAASLYGWAAIARTQYEDTPTASRRRVTNGLYLASVGTGTVAVGLAGVAVFTGRF